jgi:hypothetical protein
MPFEGGDINGVGTDEVRCAPDFVAFQDGKARRLISRNETESGVFASHKDLDQRTMARVSKQVKSRFSRRRRRSPPDSSGLPGARAAA